MHKYYSKKLILDYVFGNDIKDYDIDDLENDYIFMMEVIKYTKDKKMYDLCSENVKLNHEFVKFLIIMFQEDKNFIKKVYNYYLENRTPYINEYNIDVEYDELSILMNNLITNKNDEDFFSYRAKVFGIYMNLKMQIESFLEEEKNNHELINELGLGFFLVIDSYENSDIVLEFFAKRYLLQIFEDREDLDLKRYLHQRFSKFEDIEKIGINNFFINYIASYDAFLATYISTHIYLLDDLKKEMLSIKNNWNYFSNFLIKEKIDIIFENTKQCLKDNKIENHYYYLEVVCYILQKLNLLEELKKYNEYLEKLNEDYIENQEYYDNTFNPSIPELPLKKALKEIENMIITTLKNNTIVKENKYIDIEEKQNIIKKKAKILKFKSIRTN